MQESEGAPTAPPAPSRRIARGQQGARHPRGAVTMTRILDAAEALFADRGYRATGLRAIAAAADAEVGLITYYFGSKQALIEAVITRRAGAGERAMLRALDRIEQAGRGSDVTAILTAFAEAILLPLERENPAGLNYLRLVIRHDAELREAYGSDDLVMAPHYPVRARYIAALERALPSADPAAVLFGFEVFEGAFSRMLFDPAIDIEDDRLRRARVAEMRRCLVPFCAAGFTATIAMHGRESDPVTAA